MNTRQKPEKPSPDFPLFPHKTGYWAKKIRGKLHYFGRWEDPQGALDKYLQMQGGIQKVPTGKPSKVTAGEKPEKPYAEFPLFPHPNGQWAKKIRRKCHYFGPWANPQAALDKYLADKDDLFAGREPARKDGLTVGGLVNAFLSVKKKRADNGELEHRTVEDYRTVMEKVIAVFGFNRLVEDLRPTDFESLRDKFAETHGAVVLANDIQRVRVLFNYAARTFKAQVDYGDSFKKPTKAVLRKERNKRGEKFFEADEIRQMLVSASKPLRAMILLGINCGFHNNDCAKLQISDLDLKGGWHNFPRPKTGIVRRCPLWPETVKALKEAIADRPEPRDPEHKQHVFITSKGKTWEGKNDEGNRTDSPISKEMAKLLEKLGFHREGVNFQTVRRTFQTVGDGSGQAVAVKYTMGNAPQNDDMAAIYRQKTFEDNLVIVSDYVRKWLLNQAVERKTELRREWKPLDNWDAFAELGLKQPRVAS